MVSEVRFRDVLCNNSNFEILSKKISELMEKNVKLTLLSKELPLPFDVVGLQLKYCDIVGFDRENNIYIIELKRKITTKNLVKTEKQVNEYVDTFKKTIDYINSKKPLLYYHKIFIRYFKYVRFDYTQIKDIIPVIMSIEEVDDTLIKTCSLSFGSIGNDLIEVFLKNFLEGKTQHFLNTYKKLFSTEMGISIESILEYAIKKQNIGREKWFPVILNRNNFIGENKEITINSSKSQIISHNYTIIFENVDNFKKISVDVTDKFEKCFNEENKHQKDNIEKIILKLFTYNCEEKEKDDHLIGDLNKISTQFSNIPELYYQFNPEEIFDKINSFYKYADYHNTNLKFIIQLFRSGRTFPIIYLQIFENMYIPLIQIKPVVISIGPSVNEVIATDMKEEFTEDKRGFYDDVISFDTGTYEISLIESKGVNFYSIKLFGKRNKYEFKVYSPKFRPIKELLPYMCPEKVKIHLENVKNENETNYLFKINESDPAEWITSKIHIL